MIGDDDDDVVDVVVSGLWRRLCGTPGLAPRIPRLMQLGGVRNLHRTTHTAFVLYFMTYFHAPVYSIVSRVW